MKFEFFVLNYDINKKTTEMFNIFRNIYVQEETEKAIRKYLRSPKNFKYEKSIMNNKEPEYIYGFEALCARIDSILRWQEWGRCEYEISAGDKFTIEVEDILNEINKYIKEEKSLEDFKTYLEIETKKNSKLKAWDCYEQSKPNIEIIVRECIYQYKNQLKKKED